MSFWQTFKGLCFMMNHFSDLVKSALINNNNKDSLLYLGNYTLQSLEIKCEKHNLQSFQNLFLDNSWADNLKILHKEHCIMSWHRYWHFEMDRSFWGRRGEHHSKKEGHLQDGKCILLRRELGELQLQETYLFN